ncbi:adaptin ear-binding coat-associated protein 1 NECAP-1 [Moesziomyces antarcticus]|uniref:Related to Adaptin ear-binding coat-associated protein 2 n=2 Tax=Pseudozyma antarctica TaxID=84753 RepID=A0A5C3FUP9_PSEA2|nr:adaptin ear-binding coat-associated protein 1 NECAP-1 [Moesziomyces antarcticus]GAK66935.1 adaptin ear-binding coat-associated protein 1 NECAP-1 [Moesziomyces antarcticus]SPO47986.1 related to Adaptin ear-binding coat-associated protein 2 [Moesziomyces antarcticus]
MSGYETVLFVARECFVYRVPPRSSTAGYKAGEWGDMEAFLWKGRLRIMESSISPTCSIRLEDGDTGELFAECPYDVKGTSVEPVLDSSRYFVLRVESQGPDGAKKKAYIGMGFQDRSDSFDFNVALQDWTKRQKAAASRGTNPETDDGALIDEGPSPHLPSGPKKDFSLKEGETFAIKIPGGGGRKITSSSSSSSNTFGAGFGGAPLLPPPPSKKR